MTRPESTFTRRRILAALPAFALAPAATRAKGDVTDVEWRDLLPGTGVVSMESLRAKGVVSHDTLSIPEPDWEPPTFSAPPVQSRARGVTTAYDGKTIRMRGYVVPLVYSGTGVTQFILVPFAGACIHVPPPPANQLVFVTAVTPFESRGLEEAVAVTGRFASSAISTQLGEIGYEMAATEIERNRRR